MVVNPVGAVAVYDGGTPRLITALTPVGVTGGQLVYLSGGANVVGSSADGFSPGSVLVGGVASGAQFNGIVVTPGNTASGTQSYVTIATAGTFIVSAGGTVIGGYPVECVGQDAVQQLTSGGALAASSYTTKMGRAITGASSGTSTWAVIQVTP